MALRARDNPFAVQRVATLGHRLQGAGWDELLARFAALGWRGALVGLEGHGKSTLMAALAARLAEQGWRSRAMRLRRGERRPAAAELGRFVAGAGPRDLLLVDGAQELSPLAWRSLVRAARGAGAMLVTSHRPGRLPTLHECRTTPALLAELMAELAPAWPGLPPAVELFDRHRGNLRDALLEAYDRCARRRDPRAAPSTAAPTRPR